MQLTLSLRFSNQNTGQMNIFIISQKVFFFFFGQATKAGTLEVHSNIIMTAPLQISSKPPGNPPTISVNKELRGKFNTLILTSILPSVNSLVFPGHQLAYLSCSPVDNYMVVNAKGWEIWTDTTTAGCPHCDFYTVTQTRTKTIQTRPSLVHQTHDSSLLNRNGHQNQQHFFQAIRTNWK